MPQKNKHYGKGPFIKLKVEVFELDAEKVEPMETYFFSVPHNTPPDLFPVIAHGVLFENDWSIDDIRTVVTQVNEVKYVGTKTKG